MRVHNSKALLAASLTALLATGGHAAGFALIENSASGMGSAYASGGAAVEDASTIWFNPAGMTRLEGQHALVAVHYIATSADFTNNGSTNADGTPLSGPNANGGKGAFIPNLYYSAQINDTLFAGIGVTTPFGLGTRYDDDWVGRYHAVDTELMTININPSIAYKINEQWSIGGGVNIQYVDVKLTSAIDFGAMMGAPGTADGFGDLTGDNGGDLSFGWNLGVLYSLNDHTRFSLAYRSAVKHHVTGDADFSVPASAAPLVTTGAFQDTHLYADVELPASVSVSAFHALNDSLDLMADLTWTNWSVFKELRIQYTNPSQPDSVTTENYQDQWRAAVGGRYHVDQALMLRMGLAYDQRAVRNKYYRTPRTPDTDRTWLSVGMGYQFSKMLGMDLGYTHLFVDEAAIENTYESSIAALQHTLKGSYDSNVDIFSAQLTLKF